MDNYLPYAKGTIIGRAIPSIDGLKPVQRRLLYSMYKMGLLKGGLTKSTNAFAETMKLHPHGDMSIYETMVRMTEGNESLNVPYIESKGNFGKVYSKDMAYAAPRYTEVKLAKICEEIFDGIDENAVDFIDNFDNTTKEPTLLPVKFPTILVNPSSGIAVGTSSNIPSFSLKNVCKATIGILEGTIDSVEKLMDVLGVPEYTTGGFIHASKEDLIELGKTGKGTFTMSGHAVTYQNEIVITEIPYKTTVEGIVNSIEDLVKSEDLKEVSDVMDETGLKGLKITVKLKRGKDPYKVLNKLYRLTPLRLKISYNTRVILNNRCIDIGLYDLLKYWIEFRMEVVKRVYSFRKDKVGALINRLEAWEKIKDDIREVARLIADKKEIDVRGELKSKYSLSDEQVDYLMETKVRMFTVDNLNKRLEELDRLRKDYSYYIDVIEKDELKKEIIINELKEIRDKYGKDNLTSIADPIKDEDLDIEEEIIDDSEVIVVLTKSGYIKRLVTNRDINNFKVPVGEEELFRWKVRNNEDILVFTYDGDCYKIPVNSIDASKGGLKVKITSLINLQDASKIFFIDPARDYKDYINIVYPNGRGTRVYYSKVSGNRSKYKSLFKPSQPKKLWLTKEDKFFIITKKKKAAYADLTIMNMFHNRVAFKVARIMSNDEIVGIHPAKYVPNIKSIDLSRYMKGYCVSIKYDILW